MTTIVTSWIRWPVGCGEQGYDVTECATYRQALQQLDAHPPELLLADVRLQDGDGFDLLAYSRQKYPERAGDPDHRLRHD